MENIKYVQFTDENHTTVCTVFGSPQDPDVWDNLGEVQDDDLRYLAFINPPPDYLGMARLERNRLLAYATLKINPLQDLVDIGEAEDSDEALLLGWKKYRAAVGNTETKPGWPVTPQWPLPPVELESSSSVEMGQ